MAQWQKLTLGKVIEYVRSIGLNTETNGQIVGQKPDDLEFHVDPDANAIAGEVADDLLYRVIQSKRDARKLKKVVAEDMASIAKIHSNTE